MTAKFANLKRRSTAKISTMPRQHSEASVHLELYKLLVEKQRLQQELDTLEQRRQEIFNRLTVLDSQTANLEQPSGKLNLVPPAKLNPQPRQSSPFEMLLLEY